MASTAVVGSKSSDKALKEFNELIHILKTIERDILVNKANNQISKDKSSSLQKYSNLDEIYKEVEDELENTKDINRKKILEDNLEHLDSIN